MEKINGPDNKNNEEMISASDTADVEASVEISNDDAAPSSDENANGGSGKSSFFKPQSRRSSKGTKVPLWAVIMAVLIAATIVFEATYVILTDLYEREIDAYKIYAISENERTSELSDKLSRTYSVIDQITDIFNNHYIYEVDYDALIENILRDYVAETGDKYAEYYTEDEYRQMLADSEGNSVGIGTYVTYGINENELDDDMNLLKGIYIAHVMSGSPAENAGIKAGDIITEIDGQSIVGIYYGDAVDMIKGEIGTSVTLSIDRDGTKMTVDVERNNYTAETVLYRTIEQSGHKIGYLRIIQFYSVTYGQFKNAIRALQNEKCEGIIFDLRADGGGYLDSVCNILDYILPEGPIVKQTFSDGTNNVYRSNKQCIEKIPMVVLVDNGTASAAELFTSAIKDYDYATIIGVTTYGKGCGQTFYALKNGGSFKLTTFLYDPPYSENYDGVGITPDIIVDRYDEVKNKSLFYLTDDEDAQLKAALENILSKLK